ncbi:hypothetical protein BJ508DRAFT_302874 [Ascobolus immersus RN42]|uniref:Uncharacterized protein n=1 Tax=Ascobolus immersus RN42 TaxID=1160509 RepID=A0A3N4IHK5_ASCIM|nr:hypothetical protein BJ508DRAFT_302874 [Ascobolus immersus RN42]
MVRLSEYICSGAYTVTDDRQSPTMSEHSFNAFNNPASLDGFDAMRTPTASTAPSTTTECPPYDSTTPKIDEIKDTYHHVHRLTEVATIGCMRLRDFDTFTPQRFSQFDADMRAELQWILSRPNGVENVHSGKLKERLKALCRKYCIYYDDGSDDTRRNTDLLNVDLSPEKRLRAALSDRRSWSYGGGHQNNEAAMALETVVKVCHWRGLFDS